MAVQAQQYPTTIMFPNTNNREEHEGKGGAPDLLLLPMQGQASAFADHHHHSFILNGGTTANSINTTRKRMRDDQVVVNDDPAAPAGAQFDPVPCGGLFSLQLPQAVPATATVPFSGDDPSLVCNSQRTQFHWLQHQPSLVSTGLHLQLPLQQQPQQRAERKPQLMLMPSSCSIADDLAASIRIQQDEIDRLLHDQTEHLRRAMADTSQRQLHALVAAAEEAAARRLRDKEAELDTAKKRTTELEQRVTQLSAQTALWRDKARANVVAAASLQARIRQVTAERAALAAAVEDPDPVGSDAESACVDPRRVERESASKPVGVQCRRCRRGDAVVVVLPCRHLCVCRTCEPAVQACPVCFCARSACVEVYLS